MKIKKMNKKGAALTGGMVLLILAVLAVIYVMNLGGIQDIFQPATPTQDIGATTRCPSSGLTEVTLNTQEALASTATNSKVSYYVYDNGALVKEGNTGNDGSVSFDLACGVNKKYSMLVINETDDTGVYPQTVTIDATDATEVLNLKTYEYGSVHVTNLGSSADPSEGAYISSGLGKTCGIVLTFANNESASAFNKPLIMCLANTSSVVDINFNGVTSADAKAPVRISVDSGNRFHTFEMDGMLLSTTGAQKLTGTVQFSASTAAARTSINDTITCRVVDQSTFKISEYKTLSLNEGWLEAAENTETVEDIGAPDSNVRTMYLNGTGLTSGYC